MIENIRLSFQGLWSHKMRSILTMLGIIIGIAAVMAIVSTIKGTNDQIREQLIGSGKNTVNITLQQGGNNYMTDYGDQANIPAVSEDIREKILSLSEVENITAYRSGSASVFFEQAGLNDMRLYGIDSSYLETCGYTLKSGRGLNQKDYDEYRSKEKNRDRYEYRRCCVSTDPECVSKTHKEWPFVKTVGWIRQTRILMIRDKEGNDITPGPEQFAKTGTFRQIPSEGDKEKDTVQTVGIISDLKLSASESAKFRRDHWSVENRLHHVLDDSFREDRSPAKKSRNNLAFTTILLKHGSIRCICIRYLSRLLGLM